MSLTNDSWVDRRLPPTWHPGDELLVDVPEQLSPRLRWMRKHGIQIYPPHSMPVLSDSLKDWFKNRDILISGSDDEADYWCVDHEQCFGDGATLSDALNDAVKNGASDPGAHPREASWNWRAGWLAVSRPGDVSANGDTEDSALVALARASGLKLWNE